MKAGQKKRVFIVHGWDGYPENGWFPWLKKELESRGFLVFIPQPSKAEEPRIENWVPALKELIGELDEQTFFVGHSMVCQAIARCLEDLSGNTRAGGAVFVAGFFKRLTLKDDDITRSVVNEWLKTPLDLIKVKKHLKKSVAIFSDDDPYVPLDNIEEYGDILGSKIITEKGKGHFSGSTGTFELPIALASVLEISE